MLIWAQPGIWAQLESCPCCSSQFCFWPNHPRVCKPYLGKRAVICNLQINACVQAFEGMHALDMGCHKQEQASQAGDVTFLRKHMRVYQQ